MKNHSIDQIVSCLNYVFCVWLRLTEILEIKAVTISN